MANDHLTSARRNKILNTLPEAPKKISTPDLYKKVNATYTCSQRSIQRDLEALSLEYSISCEKIGTTHYWFYTEKKDLKVAPKRSNALSLVMAKPYLQQVLPPNAYKQLQSLLDDANRTLSDDRYNLSRWPERVRVLPEGKQLLPPPHNEQIWQMVSEALLQNKKLDVTYTSRAEQTPKNLTLTPLALVAKGTVRYLVATANNYTNPVIYALQRIERAEITDECCPENNEFRLNEYLSRFGWINEGETTLVATITSELAKRLNETKLSHQQEITPLPGGDYHRLEAVVPDDKETLWWVYGLNENIQVHAPTHWVEQLAETTRKMANFYSGQPAEPLAGTTVKIEPAV